VECRGPQRPHRPAAFRDGEARGVTRVYDCSRMTERERGLRDAVAAIRASDLVVLPTDTVYGIGADAFTPAAVEALLMAKGRGRDMPAPVLVGSARTLAGLVEI